MGEERASQIKPVHITGSRNVRDGAHVRLVAWAVPQTSTDQIDSRESYTGGAVWDVPSHREDGRKPWGPQGVQVSPLHRHLAAVNAVLRYECTTLRVPLNHSSTSPEYNSPACGNLTCYYDFKYAWGQARTSSGADGTV